MEQQSTLTHDQLRQIAGRNDVRMRRLSKNLEHQDIGTNILQHHGVKGMHWGTHKGMKAERKWEKSLSGTKLSSHYINAHNEANIKTNYHIQKFNEDWVKKHGENYGSKYEKAFENSGIFEKHNKETARLMNERINSISPTGHREAKVHVNGFLDYHTEIKHRKKG